jgi:hypothetical protein
MASIHGFQAHTKPPEDMRVLFKRLQKSGLQDIASDGSILNLPIGLESRCNGMRLVKILEAHDLERTFRDFLQISQEKEDFPPVTAGANSALYEIEALPGQLECFVRQLPIPL